MKTLKRFDIHWIDLNPTRGSEIQKTRPCIIASPDVMNTYLDHVIVIPITTTIRDYPFRMSLILKQKKQSIACDHIRSVDRSRIGKKIGTLPSRKRRVLSELLIEIFAL